MRHLSLVTISLFLAAFILAIAAGCSETPVTRSGNVSSSDLALNLDMSGAPDNVTQIVAILSREGFSTQTIYLVISDNTASGVFDGVAIGEWHLQVNALDSNDLVLFTGETDVNVLPGGTTNVELVLHAASGSITITVRWPRGLAGNALRLDGVNDFAEVVNSESLQGVSDALSMEAWVWPVDQYYNTVVSKGSATYAVEFAKGQRPGFIFQNLELDYEGAENFWGRLVLWSSVPAETWTHVAVTLAEGDMRVFVNGVLAYHTTFTGTLEPDTADLRIGARADFNYPENFHGDIDELRIWNVARTAEEIQSAMESELTGTEPGLIAYWNFNGLEESGVIPDESPNNNNAMPVNGAHLVPSSAF